MPGGSPRAQDDDRVRLSTPSPARRLAGIVATDPVERNPGLAVQTPDNRFTAVEDGRLELEITPHRSPASRERDGTV